MHTEMCPTTVWVELDLVFELDMGNRRTAIWAPSLRAHIFAAVSYVNY